MRAPGVSAFHAGYQRHRELDARFRKAVRHRGHFPNEQAALKVLYLVATEKRKNR